MPPEHLARLQERFWKLLTLPGGVAGRLPRVRAEDLGVAPLAGWVAAASEAQAADRLERYAGMYFARLLEILQDDYPKLHELVGTQTFENLARDYLATHPSEDPSVRHVGGRLAAFLKTHELSREFPYLPDLAALEWARLDVFDRAEPPALLAPEALAAIAPEQWAGLRFEPIASLELLRLEYPAERIWLALQRDESLPTIEAESTNVLIWREGFAVLHRTLPAAEARALECLRAGESFGEICEAFGKESDSLKQGAFAAACALARWVADKLIVRLSLPDRSR